MRGDLNYAKAKKAVKLKDGILLYKQYSINNKLSYRNDSGYIDKLVDFWGENQIVEQITPSGVEEYKTWLKTYKAIEKVKINNPDHKKEGCRKQFIYKEIEVEKNRSNATINRHIEMLSKFFNIMIDEGLIKENPCRSVKHLREENFKIRFLTKEEEKRLFDAIDANNLYLKPIIICALQTGMRKSEIFNLKWSQIDFKQGYIEILKSKSGKARKIPISSRLDAVLKEILALSSNEYVFVNPETNKPFVDIKRAFATILEKAGIDNFRFHDLRHTVATRMVESGADLTVVQEILGHASIQTTMRYAHPVPERKKQAIDYLSSLY